MSPTKEVGTLEYSITQLAWIQTLTDQQIANLTDAADFVASLNNDQRDFVRAGTPQLLKFLREAKPETLKFLGEARKDEVEKLQSGIKLVVALETVGTVMKWSLILFFGTLMGIFTLWEKFSALFKKG